MSLYEFHEFRFDPENHLLSSGGSPVPLTPKAFEILHVLVQNGGRLTTKEELMRRVWPDSFVEEANLTVNISALRKVLGDNAEGRQCIATVPKKGYRFVAAIRAVQSDTPAGRLAEAQQAIADLAGGLGNEIPEAVIDAESQQQIPERKARLAIAVIGLSLFLVVALVIGYFLFRSRSIPNKTSAEPRRLAVLPFQNLRENG